MRWMVYLVIIGPGHYVNSRVKDSHRRIGATRFTNSNQSGLDVCVYLYESMYVCGNAYLVYSV